MTLLKSRRMLFFVLCAGCTLATVIFGIVAARRPRTSPAVGSSQPARTEAAAERERVIPDRGSLAKPEPSPIPVASKAGEAGRAEAVRPLPKPSSDLLYFRSNSLGDHYGKLTVASLDSLDRPQYSGALYCDRLHFAGGRGVCLVSERGVFTKYFAAMFDDSMQPGKRIPLNGIPSRVKVSPSGRLAAITVFLAGQSYTSLNLSTQTTIVDPVHGEILIPDMETFSISRNGEVFRSPDFNFWGVTFAHDENRFYATLWSKGSTYLIEGDLAKRTAKVIYDGVECPSLSPDNTRVAFKKRVGSSGITWHIHVLDLKTMTDVALTETRSVDDQIEWLDNDRILYALSENEAGSSASTDLWVLPVNGSRSARLLLKGAFSPAVVSASR
jgi:hypothetical protein